jgi:hypothetical protein
MKGVHKMTELETLKDYVENKGFLVKDIEPHKPSYNKITLVHSGKEPIPEQTTVIMITGDFECESYAIESMVRNA